MVDETKNSFVFYQSFLNAIKCLPKENQLYAYQYITEYALQWIIPKADEDQIAYAIFLMAKPQIDANTDRRKNWAKWGAPEGNKNASKNRNTVNNWEIDKKQPKVDLQNNQKQPNVNVNVNVNDNVNELKISSNEEIEQRSCLNKDISNLIDAIKQQCDSLGVAYDKYKDRYFANFILTAKEFWAFCEKIWQDRVTFALNVLKASFQIKFRKWICTWPMKIYQNYADVYNETLKQHTKNQKNLIQSF